MTHSVTEEQIEREFVFKQTVSVVLKERAFTPEFMAEFNETQYELTIPQHSAHIAQMAVRGVFCPIFFEKEFVDGYGELGEFVESISLGNSEVESTQ